MDTSITMNMNMASPVSHSTTSAVAAAAAVISPVPVLAGQLSTGLESLKLKRHSALADFLFGSAAGFTSKIVEHPFDTIKVRLQTQPLSTPTTRPLFTGPLDCLRKSIRADGVRSLFRGIVPPVIGSMGEHAILFSAYVGVQPYVHAMYGKTSTDPTTISELATSGAIAGAFASVVLTPLELVKCKQQVRDRSVSSITVVFETIKKDGFAGLFRGHAGTFMRETAGGAAWFGIYEAACNGFCHFGNGRGKPPPDGRDVDVMEQHQPRTRADLTAMELMAAGSMAGIGYNVSLFPADVKSIQQTEDEIRAKSGVLNHQRTSFMTVARDLYRGEGVKGFYRGLGVTLCRSIPGSALIVATFELLTRYCSVDETGH